MGCVVEMEENTELEEGEACYYKDGDDNIDLESLSYIDERIQHVLGHFQKDFEGGVFAENLGAKFGGYGSFLPTYERSPPSWSHPKTPQRNYISPKSPNNHHVEAASDNSKAPSNGSPSIRLGTVSHGAHSFHKARVPSVNDSMKKDIGVSSNVGAERCPLKDDSTSKSGSSTDQRTLKFRIKMKSDNVAQKKAEIYSGLGLDLSPSSSMENSPEEIGRMPQASQETGEESPIGIIQAMTSFPIPGGALISPLHDSLLYLIRKEKVLGDSNYFPSFNGQEYCSMSTDESDSFVGEEQLLKKRKVRILHSKKRLGNKTSDTKVFLSNDLKYTPLSSSICNAGETAEVTGRASKVSKKVNKDGANGRMGSTEAVKEESLESISGQDFDKSEKQHMGNGSMQKVIDHELPNSLKDNSIDPKNNSKCKSYIISQKEKFDVMKFKVGHDSQKDETNQKRKPLSDGKHKSMGDQSPSKAMAVAKKDSFEAGNNAMINNKKSAGFDGNCKSKLLKTKSFKDNKVKDTDSLKGHKSEKIINGIDLDGLPGHRAVINANHDNFEEQNAYQVKVKERPSSNKMGNKSMAGPGIKDASNECSVAGIKSAPETVQIASAPQLIEENWVCCDRCQRWRLLPVGIKPEQLPEKWLCSMLNWLPGMNRCDISEEMTTKALYGLCQMPISEGQNNIQSNATGTAIGVGSADALQFGLSYQNSSSDVLSDQGKKKLDFKEKKKVGISTDKLLLSDSAQNNAQEAGKTKSDQHPVELNPMRKPGSQRLGKLNNLMEVKHVPKEKDQKLNGGDRKDIKLNHKMDADQYKSGTPMKSKTEDFWSADKLLNPSLDLEKVGQNSRTGFSTKASGKDMWKYDEYWLSDDVQDKLVVPVKKQGDQAQVSTDGGSLDVKRNRKRDASMKKRKLEDRQDTDNPNDTFSLQDDKQYGEGNLSGYRREKMFKVINTEEKSVFKNNDKINRKGGLTQGCLSTLDSKNHAAVAAEEVGSVDKVYLPRKRSKNIASHKVLDGVDPLGRDLGSGQQSLAATSSSSKVSGSHKARRTNFEDMKGSPVESVTSSPLRVSNLDKLTLAGGDTSDKDNATKGVLSSVSSRRYSDNKEGKLSVKVKERVLYDLPPESHKRVSMDFQVEDAKNKTVIQAKTSEVRDDHLVNGDAATIEQHGDANHGDKVNKSNQESALSWQKSGKVASLRGKERDRRSGSKVDKNKMKVSASENGYSKNGGRYVSAVDPSYRASGHGAGNDVKCSLSESKREIDNTGKKNSVRHWPSEIETQTELKQKDSKNSSLKADAPCSTKKEDLSRTNLIEGFVDGNKADNVWSESRDGKSKVLSSLESEGKREMLSGSRTAPGSQKGGVLTEHPVHASGNGDVGKLMKSSTDASSKDGINCSSENFGPDRQLNVSTPVTINSSQTAYDTLKEATNLRDRADHFKNTGFEFESKETYFEAALKFLHGASLLENFHKESGKYGDMSQMRIYTTAAKLFESCAHEYERHHEMPSAALAYKCMEVAYMRVVYCKYSGANRDRHELQSTLQMAPQGESPLSSASDVDNLNNQAAVYKSTSPRGNTGTHVAGNQVMSARNRSNFVRLLDFTQDVNYAMEASRNCQSTLAAANVIMEEAQNKDCKTSIRRVIDLSFQDVDELVGLVWIATKAISRADLGGARD